MKKILTSCLVAVPLIVMADTIPSLGTNGGAMVLPEGKLTLNYRQLYFKRDSMHDGSSKVTNSENLNAKANISIFAFGYGLDSKTTLSLIIPYKNFRADAKLGQDVKVRNSGLSDIWLNARRIVYNSNGFLVAVDGGVKFPTGSKGKTFKQKPMLLNDIKTTPPPTQLGTGEFEYKIGVGATKILDESLRIDSNMHYIYRPKAKHDYDFGNEFAFNIGAVKALEKRFNVGLDYAYTYNSKTDMGNYIDSTRGSKLPFKAFSGSSGYITPSVQFLPFGKPKLHVSAGVSFLAHYHLKERQPIEKQRYMVNIGYLF